MPYLFYLVVEIAVLFLLLYAAVYFGVRAALRADRRDRATTNGDVEAPVRPHNS